MADKERTCCLEEATAPLTGTCEFSCPDPSKTAQPAREWSVTNGTTLSSGATRARGASAWRGWAQHLHRLLARSVNLKTVTPPVATLTCRPPPMQCCDSAATARAAERHARGLGGGSDC